VLTWIATISGRRGREKKKKERKSSVQEAHIELHRPRKKKEKEKAEERNISPPRERKGGQKKKREPAHESFADACLYYGLEGTKRRKRRREKGEREKPPGMGDDVIQLCLRRSEKKEERKKERAEGGHGFTLSIHPFLMVNASRGERKGKGGREEKRKERCQYIDTVMG